jgi:hypothetical protein
MLLLLPSSEHPWGFEIPSSPLLCPIDICQQEALSEVDTDVSNGIYHIDKRASVEVRNFFLSIILPH